MAGLRERCAGALATAGVLSLLAWAVPSAGERGAAGDDQTLTGVVGVHAKILHGARSAQFLGMERAGSGAIVRNGYVATIGYLVVEAESIEITGADGRTVPAVLAGYDHGSGFGVLKLLAPLAGRPIPLGDSSALDVDRPVLVAGFGGRDEAHVVQVVSRRAFSGSWEYLLESGIFTAPAVPNWSGAPLIGSKGELLGIGSLVVSDAPGEGTRSPGNMFVPIDLLKPILGELIEHGRVAGPGRPWLGINAEELHGRLLVTRVSPGGPAERAGVRAGDIVLGVGEREVASLGEFYRQVWSRGAAGTDVPLKLLQGARVRDLGVRSIDRMEYFRPRPNL
ncbi:MAG: S1C family serine protease [Betaproteobacteria bacterium]|nr:S1C family serine protease [Betaproteobacteria bacterium]